MNAASASEVTYRARYVLPLTSAPVENGIVRIADGKILSIGPYRNESDVEDLGDVAIIPALVNAYTNLELSSLTEPLKSSQSFTNWLGELLDHRKKQQSDVDTIAAINNGLTESHSHGVGFAGAIDSGADWSEMNTSVTGVRFLELMGLGEESIEQAKRQASKFCSPYSSVKWHRGLSPSSAYTTHRNLVQWAAKRCYRDGAPLAMHLAETPEELRFLQDQSGPIRELLESQSLWNEQAFESGLRPLDYLDLLASARRVSVIHGNYLTPDELSFMGIHGAWMTLVFCPRTHDYFGHADYPLEKALALGVQVALGTGSRASNPDLSIWREIKFVAEKYPSISPQTILEMGTLRASHALGFPSGMSIGSRARLAAISLSPAAKCDCPYEWIVSGDSEPRMITH